MSSGRDVHPVFARRRAALAAVCFLVAAATAGTAAGQALLPQPRPGEPLPGLAAAELALFIEGRAVFESPIAVVAGLGPTFNQTSCGGCHSLPASGGSGTISVTRFGRAEPGFPFDPLLALGGSLLQAQAIDDACREIIPALANVVVPRTTPPIFGAGLVEAIPDAAILALESGGGVAHLVPALEDPAGPLRVGRFGWKSQVATVLGFSGDASRNELGLTNRLVPTENAPNGDAALLAACDAVPDPEDGPDAAGYDLIDRMTHFQRYLAPPPQTPRTGMMGEAHFGAIGCAACHRSAPFVTGAAPEAALSGVAIHPYSDFLLHDMGDLGDGIVQGGAAETMMRTAPLWGLRLRDAFLHDGSASGGTLEQRIVQAVAAHEGEGAASAAAFSALDAVAKSRLVAFLGSLGRREFDHDGNGQVDLADFIAFRTCAEGPGGIGADDPCAVSDIDHDGDVDLADFGSFLLAFDGPLADCDGDATPDLVELMTGASEDCDGNAVPDPCDIASGAAIDADSDGIPDECQVPVQWNVIWCAEESGGAVDSCGALSAALAALGEAVVVVDSLTSPAIPAALPPGSAVWALLGTYPDNHVLTSAQGSQLRALAASGTGVYIEGSDIRGFDPPTSFEGVDGVEDATVVDGDNSFTRMKGFGFGALDLSDLDGVLYLQDQPATDERTDRIQATGTTPGQPVDLGGANAGVVWRNDPESGSETPYPVATFYAPVAPYGRVIAQTWEFGGFGGDTIVLCALYRSVFAAALAVHFLRGDCNGDLGFDLADPIATLAYLFAGGAEPGCAAACDPNVDGTVDVGDAILALAALFTSGPPPGPPFPACGPDPAPGPLGCALSPCP